MENRSFAAKVLTRLERLDAKQIEAVIAGLIRERRLFAALLDEISDGLLLLDEESRIVLINAAARRMLGLEDERRGPGESVRRALRGEAFAALRRLWEDFARDRVPRENERILLPAPNKITLEVSIIPLKIEEAAPGLAGGLQPNGEIQPDGGERPDGGSRSKARNQADREAANGYNSKAIEGFLANGAFESKARPKRQRAARLNAAMNTKARMSREAGINREAEAEREVGINREPGEERVLWLLRDASRIERGREEKERARYLEVLTALTAGLAHEIRNPLNALSIHASLLREGAGRLAAAPEEVDAERMNRSAEVLIEEIARLNRLVEQFLLAARPVKLDRQLTRIDDLFRQIAKLLEPECKRRSIELLIDSDPDLPPIPVDRSQIHQVILNLARNGVEAIEKATPENPGRVELHSRGEKDHVLLEVSDTGKGIPEADREKIFEPYYTTKEKGSGLGLMVVWRIVKAHGGAIAVDSRPGAGTTFSIALPLDARPLRLLSGKSAEPDHNEVQ